MNRATHMATSAANHKALLSVRIHVKDQTELYRAYSQRGLVISHALPSQSYPGMTGVNSGNTHNNRNSDSKCVHMDVVDPVQGLERQVNKDLEIKLARLDEVITELDRINNELQTLIQELEYLDE